MHSCFWTYLVDHYNQHFEELDHVMLTLYPRRAELTGIQRVCLFATLDLPTGNTYLDFRLFLGFSLFFDNSRALKGYNMALKKVSPNRRRSIAVPNQNLPSLVPKGRRRAHSIVPGATLSPMAKARRSLVCIAPRLRFEYDLYSIVPGSEEKYPESLYQHPECRLIISAHEPATSIYWR